MEIEIKLEDINLLESKMENLAGWMMENIDSFPAVAYAISILSNAIADAKEQLTADEDTAEEE